MSIEIIIQSLQKLITVHESLLDLSKQKTEVVKEGSIDKFQQILSKERKFVQMLEKAEQNRQQVVEQWFVHQGHSLDNITITKMLDLLKDGEEKNNLETVTIELTNRLTELKQQEQLNQELIRQSMQFVQISLDMMQPTIKNMNYGNQNNDGTKRSVFDSKA